MYKIYNICTGRERIFIIHAHRTSLPSRTLYINRTGHTYVYVCKNVNNSIKSGWERRADLMRYVVL